MTSVRPYSNTGSTFLGLLSVRLILSGGGRPQIKVHISFQVCRTSIKVCPQPHFGLIGHSLVVSPFICNTLFHSLSNDNQATKFTGVLPLLEAMLSTVKLRVKQEVNIYQFEVDNIYCQIKEIMG